MVVVGISCGGVVTSSSTGGGGSAGCSSFSFLAFFLRCRQNSIRQSMAMSAARPPTTPPAIAPTLLLFEPPGDKVPVLEGKVRVAVLVTDGALRV